MAACGARQSAYRGVATTYAVVIGVAQVGWVVLIFLPLSLGLRRRRHRRARRSSWSARSSRRQGCRARGSERLAPASHRRAVLAARRSSRSGDVFGTLGRRAGDHGRGGLELTSIMVIGLGIVLSFAPVVGVLPRAERSDPRGRPGEGLPVGIRPCRRVRDRSPPSARACMSSATCTTSTTRSAR